MVITFLHFLMLLTGSIWFEPEQPGTQADSPQDNAKVILADESPMWARRWYHWDSLWFVHLSRFGYRVEQFADGSLAQSNVAFLPGLPILASLSETAGLNPWAALLVMNLVAEFILCMGLGMLALAMGQTVQAAIWCIVCYAAWPWHYFLVAPYQESVGLACLVWGLYFGINRRPLAGFSLCFASSFFRLTVIGLNAGLIAGSLAMLVLTKNNREQWKNLIFSCSGTFVGWFCLLMYFQWNFGDAQIGVKVQTAWGRTLPHLLGPLQSLASPLHQKLAGSAWLDWFASILTIGCLPFVWRYLGTVWAAGLAVLMAQSLSTGMVVSYGRYMLTAIPLFMMFGIVAEQHRKLAMWVCCVSFFLQMIIMWRFGHGLFGG